MNHTVKRWLRTSVTMATVVAAALVVLVAPASAADGAQTHVAGAAQFAEECGGETSDFTLVLEGDLTGCWYTTIWEAKETPSGIYQERGTETFVGCLSADGVEACGSFTTTYKFTGKFAASGDQIHGRCQHPIVAGSGTGDFAGATGRLDFKDDVATGIAYYRGHIKLP